MNLHSAKKDLYSSTFLIGGWRRAKALTYLIRAMEPKAVDILVEAFLNGCPSAKQIEFFFKTVKDRTKLDRLWLNWAHRGENTLAEILISRHKPASIESGQELRVLSLLLLGKPQEIEAGKELVKSLVRWDNALRNEKIIEALTHYFKHCGGKPPDWILVLSLLLGLFDAIGDSREAADRVYPLLTDKDRDISAAAKKFTAQLSQPVKIYLILSQERRSYLPVTKEQAMALQPFFSDADDRVQAGAEKYLGLVKEQNPDWLILFLLRLDREDEILQDRNSTDRILSLLDDPEADVNPAALRYVEKLPVTDQFNEAIFKAWLKTESNSLLSLINRQNRLPASPAVETLYYFISGQLDAYHALEDTNGELFLEAWLMAGDTFRNIIHEQVLKSGDGKLVNAYRKAFSHRREFNTELVKKSLMAADNEDGLFEEARRMTFIGVLDLCQRWAKNKWLPDDLRRANVVKTAVERLRQIEKIEVTEGVLPPAGTEDLFLYWEKQNPSEKELKKGLSHPDPFVRMRSLYLGHQKGMVDEARLNQAGKSDDWPERLIFRMIHPAITPDEKRDHVEWVNVCSDLDAQILNARIDCTPEAYSRYNEMLVTLSRAGAAMARSKMLLEILLAFQGYFTAGGIVAETDDGAKERDAMKMEDRSVDAADLLF